MRYLTVYWDLWVPGEKILIYCFYLKNNIEELKRHNLDNLESRCSFSAHISICVYNDSSAKWRSNYIIVQYKSERFMVIWIFCTEDGVAAIIRKPNLYSKNEKLVLPDFKKQFDGKTRNIFSNTCKNWKLTSAMIFSFSNSINN